MTSQTDAVDPASELAFLLHHAGITVPADRWDAVLAEYIAFRPHLALVNQALLPEDEPAPVIMMHPAVGRP
ncbi:MAG: hypothetical protein IBJ07_18890 [Rhizobiaceae bacterium]|nr:hypothetical protein [Rhizobiaceae bacterium]